MERVKYGILSTSQIGRYAHVPAFAEADNATLVARASRTQERAARYADALGIPRSYGSYEQLLASDDIEAVIVPLPNAMHCEWTVKAAEAGKHVLCEKPLAMTTTECRRMIDACRTNGVLLLEGFHHQFTPMMTRLKGIVGDGTIGEPLVLRAELTYTVSDWKHDVRVNSDLGGGALYDAGCYCVNTVRSILGAEPAEASGFARTHPLNSVDAGFSGLLRFREGQIAYVATSQEQPYRWPLEIVGTEGAVFTPDVFSAGEITIRTPEGTEVERFEPINRFAAQLEHFSRAVRDAWNLRVGPEDATRNTAVLVALQTSAMTGTVTAPELI